MATYSSSQNNVPFEPPSRGPPIPWSGSDCATMDAQMVSLEAVPSDVLLKIAYRLDGCSLARFVDCTSVAIKTAFEVHEDQVNARWEALLEEISPCLSAFPHDGVIVAHCSSKNKFVRSWAWLQTKCARCGRRSMPSRRVDGTIDTNRYMHLCDWLTMAKKPARPAAEICLDIELS